MDTPDTERGDPQAREQVTHELMRVFDRYAQESAITLSDTLMVLDGIRESFSELLVESERQPRLCAKCAARGDKA